MEAQRPSEYVTGKEMVMLQERKEIVVIGAGHERLKLSREHHDFTELGASGPDLLIETGSYQVIKPAHRPDEAVQGYVCEPMN